MPLPLTFGNCNSYGNLETSKAMGEYVYIYIYGSKVQFYGSIKRKGLKRTPLGKKTAFLGYGEKFTSW